MKCSNIRLRCLCGSETISDFCQEHDGYYNYPNEPGKKKHSNVCCNLCINDVCQERDCLNRKVDPENVQENTCQPCGIKYNYNYCGSHRHLEQHNHCQQVLEYVENHCAWCSSRLFENSKCETDKVICESLRNLSASAQILFRDPNRENDNNLTVKFLTAKFCQGCAKHCLFSPDLDKSASQCINCLVDSRENDSENKKQRQIKKHWTDFLSASFEKVVKNNIPREIVEIISDYCLFITVDELTKF
jgi:hypothetical protein